MVKKDISFSIYFCLFFIKEISVDMVEEQLMEETDSDLKRGGYFRVYYDRG